MEKKLRPNTKQETSTSGFTSSENQKKSSDETKVSRLETIYEKVSRSRRDDSASFTKKQKYDEDQMSHSAMMSKISQKEELSYSGSSIG